MLLEILATVIWQEKKPHQIVKKEVKLSLMAYDDILHGLNSENTTNKLKGQINESSKLARYKFNKQKSTAYLYMNNEQFEKEMKKILISKMEYSMDGTGEH